MTGAAVCAAVALSAPPLVQAHAADAGAPTVQLDGHDSDNDILQLGNDNDAYWVDDAAQNPENRTEGTAPDQYEQNIGVDPQVGPHGEVAYRMKWRWPEDPQGPYAGWVKAYPSIISGRKPGLHASNNMPRGTNVRLLDGSISLDAPSGATPGSIFPMQLPIPSLTTTFDWSHNSAPTGVGHLTYDLWLQSQPGQDSSFAGSSITHEIMIPLDNWGGYGENRPCWWLSHDVTISGILFHVYAYRDYAECVNGRNNDTPLLPNFPPGGGLDGSYGQTGWKFIVFQPAVLPVSPRQIDLAAIVNHVGSYVDGRGARWATGNEWLVSAELGVEPIQGTGDITVYNYRVSKDASPNPTFPNPPTPTTSIEAETGTLSGSDMAVRTDVPGYQGSGFVGSFGNNGDTLTVNTPPMNAGTYDINIRYHSGGSLQHNTVQIDNGQLRDVTFPATGSDWAVKSLDWVTLADGVNTIKVIKNWGWMEVDSIEIVPVNPSTSPSPSPSPTPSPTMPPPGSSARVQAESGTLTGVTAQNSLPGYDGSGYVGFFQNDGDKVAVTFPGVAAGNYDINIRYSGANQQNYVDVDGARRDENFPDTGGGWNVRTISRVPLTAGTNTIAVSKEWGYFWVDYIEIVPSTAPSTDTATRKQAENGTLTGVIVQTTVAGYDGNGYVGPFSDPGDKVAVNFTGLAAGTYDVRIRYQTSMDQQNDVTVNGASSSQVFPSTGSGWGTKTLSGVALGSGTNTVSVSKDWGWMGVDYIEVVRTG